MPEQRKPARKRADAAAAPATDDFGHLQPQELEMEQAVLGALMLEQEAYYQVAEILAPEKFYEKRHQLIYAAIRSLTMEEKPVDLLTVTEELKRRGDLDEVGGPFYITQLSSLVSSSAHIEYHARVIAQKYLARQLISYASRLQKGAFDATTDVDKLLQQAESELFDLSKNNIRKDTTQIDPIIDQAFTQLRAAASRTDGISGISSGYHALDKLTAGWQNSDLIILAARPGMGKTAFALSLAKNIAIDQKIPVAFFSLEMSNVQLVNRILSNVCEIPGEKLKSGQLEQYEWGQLDVRSRALYGAPLYVDDTPSLSIFELRTKARRLVREYGIRMIIIDYLQLMNASGTQFNSRQEEVSKISHSLKGLAKELNLPVMALSQLNRSVENRTEGGAEAKRPQLSDLRESGSIEQDADMVIFIHRPEYYHITEDNRGRDLRGKAQIIVAKHRNGAVDDVLLTFQGKYAAFRNPEEEAVPLPSDGRRSSGVGSHSRRRASDPIDDVPPPPSVDPFANMGDAPPF